MSKVLIIGFKGKNNASRIIAESLTSEPVLLTNSFEGLKRDIEAISTDYDYVLMFGVDKSLSSSVRIEKCAEKNGEKLNSELKLDSIAKLLKNAGIMSHISDTPTAYFCNDAYWHVLRKCAGKAVFIHVPTIKYVDANFVEKLKTALR